MTSRNNCTPEERAVCPLFRHFTDQHHLAYPKPRFRTTLERHWRGLADNKVDVCRAVHDAIHNSGYRPDPPSRQDMASDLWQGESEWGQREREIQLEIGRQVLAEGQSA